MAAVRRSFENPVLVPDRNHLYEAEAAFNGCPVAHGKKVALFYRALSSPRTQNDAFLEVSTIGKALGTDGIHFEERSLFLEPEEEWEKYGCEDPRVTKVGRMYYIFYTALSRFPFTADGIRVAVALSKDLETVSERHLVTPFNAKAMALFPEKINGRFTALLTIDTDLPPSKICIASFEKESDLWSEKKWNEWRGRAAEYELPLLRNPADHIEVGAPPLRTEKGWLVIYSYIRNYLAQENRVFGIEAVLLDLKDPTIVLGRTEMPLLVPEAEYERYGKVPNIVFPSGAMIKGKELRIYYGAADSSVALATCTLDTLLTELTQGPQEKPKFVRFDRNPILTPNENHSWEAKAVFNPAAHCIGEDVHLLYRAMGHDNTSVFGYARTKDGVHIDERLPDPAYVPRAPFEMKNAPGNSGVEDPRITEIGDTLHMLYTAVDATGPPRVAYTTISRHDFAHKKFSKFTFPKIISPPGIDDKDACLFPEKIGGQYVLLHRFQPSIDINFFDDLSFPEGVYLTRRPLLHPRPGLWDGQKIGVTSIPHKTSKGWLVLYHGVSHDSVYRVGAVLLDLENPEHILGRSTVPLFEPETPYEREGIVPNVVFPCGSVVRKGKLIIYYGGGDRVIGVASMPIKDILASLID